jgi:hypothetical protein
MSVVTRRVSGLLTQDSEGCPVVTGLDFRHGRLTRYGFGTAPGSGWTTAIGVNDNTIITAGTTGVAAEIWL